MKTCKVIFWIMVAMSLFSCGIMDADSTVGVSIIYNNSTEHHILLKDIQTVKVHQEDVEVLPNKSAVITGCEDWNGEANSTISDEHRYNLFLLSIPYEITIVWDGEYSITFSKINKDKLLIPESYEYIKSIGSNWWEYGYTFTEEDYEYAKMYGEKIVAE